MNPFVLQLPSDWTFFGLTFEYNQRVYDQIFDLSFYGQGGLPYDDVYNMPVNLRSYYYAKLVDIMEARRKEQENIKNKMGHKR